MNESIILAQKPVITSQTRAVSHEGHPLQHLLIACCCLMPLHKLKLHCSLGGKSTLDHDGVPPLCCVENVASPRQACSIGSLSEHSFFFSSENKTLLLWMCQVSCSLTKSKLSVLWRSRRRGLWRCFFFLKPVFCRCLPLVIGLQSAPVLTLIYYIFHTIGHTDTPFTKNDSAPYKIHCALSMNLSSVAALLAT